MIVVKERSHSGHVSYTLKHLPTGQTREWTPPEKLARNRYDDALLYAAMSFEAAVSATQKSDPENINPRTSFAVYVHETFLPRKSIKIAEHTRDGWNRCLEGRILPIFGSTAVKDIRSSEITTFLYNLQGEGLACATVVKYYQLFRSIFKMAYTDGAITENPMVNVERPTPRKDELEDEDVQAYTASEIKRLEACMEDEPLKWRTMVCLLDDTGMRIGECCALTWDCIDFAAKSIKICSSVGYTPDKGVYVTTTKNRRKRTVDVSDKVLALLVEMYAQSKKREEASAYIFPQRGSTKPMSPTTPYKKFAKLGAKYSFDNLHPHKLRHTFASIAITSGADVASVSAVLGHTNTAVTLNTYTEANAASMRRASELRRSTVDGMQ